MTERLDHGNLDFAILLQPIDISKYEYLSLPDHSPWGVLMQRSSPFSDQPVIHAGELMQMPLILHRRTGLQQTIADWAQTDIDHLHITATYNVVNGSPVNFVKHGIGYFLTTRDLLAPELDADVVFLPLDPALEVQYHLVWKRKNIFSHAARLYLDHVRDMI